MSVAELIRTDFAKRPGGFRANDVPGAESAVASAINYAIEKGQLHRAKVSYRHVRFFGDLQMAIEFEASTKASNSFNARQRSVGMKDTGAAIIPAHVQIQRIETPLPRFHVPDSFVGEFSSLPVGSYL